MLYKYNSRFFFVSILIIVGIICWWSGNSGAVNGEHDGSRRLKSIEHNNSLSKITDNRLFRIEMLNKDDFKLGENTFYIFMYDQKDMGVIGAEITITPWMPEYGFGAPGVPVITEIGDGLYHVEKVYLTKRGYWEFRIYVKKDALEDTVKFVFPDVVKGIESSNQSDLQQ